MHKVRKYCRTLIAIVILSKNSCKISLNYDKNLFESNNMQRLIFLIFKCLCEKNFKLIMNHYLKEIRIQIRIHDMNNKKGKQNEKFLSLYDLFVIRLFYYSFFFYKLILYAMLLYQVYFGPPIISIRIISLKSIDSLYQERSQVS